jgi:rubrerythrin
MAKQNESKTIAEYIQCLSKLEDATSTLYKTIAEKTDIPLVKTLFREIAIDSQKHCIVLEGVSESIAKTDVNPKDCGKKIGQSWNLMEKTQKELSKIERIDAQHLQWLVGQLAYFESIMGEEYYIFVQLKTLEILVKQINAKYNIDLNSTKRLFSKIIEDEDHHRELLETIKELVTKKEKEEDNSPAVKYQNPDSWSRPMPTTY